MQVKKIIAYALSVCLLISAISVPAYAVDEVYSITDDAAYIPASAIYYTPDYYPGAVVEMRSSGLFANTIAHGSYSEMNYNPSWLYIKGSTYPSGDFNDIVPEVIADQSDVSAVYSIPNTDFLNGQMLTFNLPNTEDGYFDFQSSNFLFDQQSAQANTFYINGTLTFNLRNLWSFTGIDGDLNTKNVSWYLASDPLAVQLVIDGKAYGDIIDVTGYTSPFTALYNGGVPTNASVRFDNLKVYYQGDTPDMIGFRVYTGSKFTNGQYNYGDFTAVGVTNTVTFRCSSIPDITFVQEGGDGYAGDLSGISSLLSSIKSFLSDISTILAVRPDASYLWSDGKLNVSDGDTRLSDLVRMGFTGLRSLLVDSSGVSWLSKISSHLFHSSNFYYWLANGTFSTTNTNMPIDEILVNGFMSQQLAGVFNLLGENGTISTKGGYLHFPTAVMSAFAGLRSLLAGSESDNVYSGSITSNENMETSVSMTGIGPMLNTYLDAMQDGIGKLSYVFASPEDLELKNQADPGTDAFRENFGGGASLSDIGDAAELTTSVPKLMDSGFDFGDAIEEIGGNDDFLSWFTVETWAALDSTGNVAAADSGYLSDYYDNLRKVELKRHWGD